MAKSGAGKRALKATPAPSHAVPCNARAVRYSACRRVNTRKDKFGFSVDCENIGIPGTFRKIVRAAHPLEAPPLAVPWLQDRRTVRMYRAAAEASAPMLSTARRLPPQGSAPPELVPVSNRPSLRRARFIACRCLHSSPLFNGVFVQCVVCVTLTVVLIALASSSQPMCAVSAPAPPNAPPSVAPPPADRCLTGSSFFVIWLTLGSLVLMMNAFPPDLVLLAATTIL